MSSFTKFDAKLKVIKSEEASKILGDDYYRVEDGFVYFLNAETSDQYVRVDNGFLSDGASVPKPLRWLIPRWGKHGQAAVLHDKLCETYQIVVVVDGIAKKKDVSRIEIDAIFYQAMRVLKVNIVTQSLIRVGVDLYRLVKRPTRPKVNPKKVELEIKYYQQ